MRQYARQHGLDLAESWAYSDSFSDYPMLAVVGHPTAVNPDLPPALDRAQLRLAGPGSS
jgi:phosphoserine phosphatase